MPWATGPPWRIKRMAPGLYPATSRSNHTSGGDCAEAERPPVQSGGRFSNSLRPGREPATSVEDPWEPCLRTQVQAAEPIAFDLRTRVDPSQRDRARSRGVARRPGIAAGDP